jgi:hypothetical protein
MDPLCNYFALDRLSFIQLSPPALVFYSVGFCFQTFLRIYLFQSFQGVLCSLRESIELWSDGTFRCYRWVALQVQLYSVLIFLAKRFVTFLKSRDDCVVFDFTNLG